MNECLDAWPNIINTHTSLGTKTPHPAMCFYFTNTNCYTCGHKLPEGRLFVSNTILNSDGKLTSTFSVIVAPPSARIVGPTATTMIVLALGASRSECQYVPHANKTHWPCVGSNRTSNLPLNTRRSAEDAEKRDRHDTSFLNGTLSGLLPLYR